MQKQYRLYNDDSFDILKKFPLETFDMIFADPPYMLSNGVPLKKHQQPRRSSAKIAIFRSYEISPSSSFL